MAAAPAALKKRGAAAVAVAAAAVAVAVAAPRMASRRLPAPALGQGLSRRSSLAARCR